MHCRRWLLDALVSQIDNKVGSIGNGWNCSYEKMEEFISYFRYSSFFLREIEDSILRISYGAISVMIMVRSHVTHRKTRQQAETLFMQLRVRLVWLVRSEQNFI